MLLTILETGVPLVAFLLMVAVGLDVTRDDLRRVARLKWTLALTTLAQVLLLPAAALAVAPWLPNDSIASFVLLVAACPGGGMSNVYVYLARANIALSVTLTAASCLAAVATMPAIFAVYAGITGRAAEFALPLPTLLAQLLIMTVVPVCAGAWIRDRYPHLERTHGGRFRTLSAAGILLIVVIGLVQSAGSLTTELLAGGVAATVLAAAGMGAGWLVGAAFSKSGGDRFAVMVEFAVRNLALAMVIEVTLLHHPAFIPFGALALLGQAVLLGSAVRLRRQRSSDRTLQQPSVD
jgi:BASS family bile acid:Na+ symporter